MNNLLQKFAALSMSKILIVGILFGGFYYMTAYDDGSSLSNRITQVNSALAEQEVKKKETDQALQQVKEMQEKVGLLGEQYQEISRRLPSVLFSIDINKAIDGFARTAGVSVKAKRPGANIKSEVVEEVPVEVELEGSYVELAQFIYYVSSAERMSRVKNVIIVDGPEKSLKKLKFTGTVVGYKLASEVAKPATGEGAQ
jgi:type IV pilus assembly protein PilO